MAVNNDEFILQCLNDALTALEADRSTRGRAIVITLLEQVIAYFAYWVLDGGK